jgi:hypothetical protein
MQLAGTRGADRPVGRAGGHGPVDPGVRGSGLRTGRALASPALGAGGAGCRVGPGRGARLSTSPFPRTALRTRRAGHPGTGLSTRPVTNKRLRCRSAPQYPTWTARSDAGIHRRLLPYRHAAAASLCPFAMCTPSRVLGLLRALRHDPPPTADDAPARRTKAGRAATGRFPRSPPPGRRGRCPALPRQPRQGYAAALPPGLLTGHYLPAAESLAAIATGVHC